LRSAKTDLQIGKNWFSGRQNRFLDREKPVLGSLKTGFEVGKNQFKDREKAGFELEKNRF